MSVSDIESEIEKLTPAELAQLMTWLQDRADEVWDDQIAADLDSGRLDKLLADVDREYDAGLAEPL